jgi:CheY-like chemotaxis protein
MLNLVLNAAQAIPEGDPTRHTITVSTGVRDGWVEIRVADTGEGIPRGTLEHIFEPFWTTKPVGVGTGLGLSIVHGIVQALGGSIEVESEPHVGSTFRVLLPPGPEIAPASTASRHSIEQPSPARILLVDDEQHFSEALRAALQKRHEVVVESSGRAGLARILSDQRFDLVVCDLMMPDVSGMTILEAVRSACPVLLPRFVLMTGGVYTDEARILFQDLGVRVLEKPFDVADLEGLLPAGG